MDASTTYVLGSKMQVYTNLVRKAFGNATAEILNIIQIILNDMGDDATVDVVYLKHYETREDHLDLGDGVPRDRVEVVRLIHNTVLSTLARLENLGLTYINLSPDTILLTRGQILLQNRLIVKSPPGMKSLIS